MHTDRIDIVFSPVYETLEKGFRMRGVASTKKKDSQGDILLPEGMDLSDFKWVNFNHAKADSADKIIGEITKKGFNANDQLEVELELFEDNEEAKKVIALAKKLEESGNGNYLSLSIEGAAVKRSEKDKSIVEKSKLYGIAICPTPINTDTYVKIAKSVGIDYSDVKSDNDAALYKAFYTHYPDAEPTLAQKIVKSFQQNRMNISNWFAAIKDLNAAASSNLEKGVKKADDFDAKRKEDLEAARASAAPEPAKKSNVAAEEDENMDDIEKAYDTCKGMVKKGEKMDIAAMRKAMKKAGYSKTVMAKAIEMILEEEEDEDEEMEKAKGEKEDVVKEAEKMVKGFILSETDGLVKGLQDRLTSETDSLKKAYEQQSALVAALQQTVDALRTEISHIAHNTALAKGVIPGVTPVPAPADKNDKPNKKITEEALQKAAVNQLGAVGAGKFMADFAVARTFLGPENGLIQAAKTNGLELSELGINL